MSADKVKARRMYACFKPEFTMFSEVDLGADRGWMPVVIMPATPEALEKMREQVAKAIARINGKDAIWAAFIPESEAVIASLGLTPTREGKGKRT